MDVDLTLQTQRPTRDVDGNAIWQPEGNPSALPSEMRSAPAIRFRHIALLLFGGIFAGILVGLAASLGAYGFTKSRFVTGTVLVLSLYGSLILGYHWTARERDWISLRDRFAVVGRKPLVIGALTAPALIAVTAALGFILKAIGISLKDTPEPAILPHGWLQFPFALFAIAIVAPICEELFFRGLLLDWLKQKMNVWIAATILSVIFSLLHANPFSLGAVGWLAFNHRFLMGLFASGLTIKYRSLRPAAMMHGTVNAIACIVAMAE